MRANTGASPRAGRAVLALILVAALFPAPAVGQGGMVEQHRAIDFLAGAWETRSEFPDGRVGTGVLEYRWVLDGAWMRVEFQGEHPDGVLWEAHAMQRWNPDDARYESWSFPASGAPVRYRGSLPEEGLFRIQRAAGEGVTTGIDYHRRDDGTVYQENWVVENGERRVTLRTTYRPREPSGARR